MRARGRLRVFAVLLIVRATIVFADTYTVEQKLFLPPEYYVGDLVELRVRISVAEDLVPSEPKELPGISWVHIRDVRVIPISDEYDIRISFSSYEPGKMTLPDIQLGELILSGIEIDTGSTLGSDTSRIHDAYDPVLLPGTRLYLALLIGGLLVVPFILVIVTIWIRAIVSGALNLRREHRPWRALNQALDGLKESGKKGREYYLVLSDCFRRYLSDRLGRDCMSLTVLELKQLLAADCPEVPELIAAANEMPVFDDIKFGGRRASAARRSKDLSSIREAATGLEHYMEALRVEQKRQRREEHVDA